MDYQKREEPGRGHADSLYMFITLCYIVSTLIIGRRIMNVGDNFPIL